MRQLSDTTPALIVDIIPISYTEKKRDRPDLKVDNEESTLHTTKYIYNYGQYKYR